MATKRKFVTGLVAGVTAAALLLGGTFAWTSISQEAKNEAAGIVNVGGRLHDDFNGTNKDVYVENFTDPLNGGQPIYARVRLDEYMEVGSEAGQADNANRKATPVVANTDINDVTTWIPHKPAESCAACATEGTCKIHEHWKWTMGGEGDNNGQTVFMPTFNKDKDSLAADINGTYAGTNADDKVYYDDYVTYVTENGIVVDVINNTATNADGTEITIEGTDALTEVTGGVSSVTNSAYYDDDADHAENKHDENIGVFKQVEETHTAKTTAEAKVITMAQWIADGSKPGNYWVYDEDGWAYWANPIMPGEATGLLLDGIKMEKNPGEKCYYAINVVAQFATVGDWEYFDGTEENGVFDGTPEAEKLLEIASKNVATVTVTNVSGETLLEPGQNYNFQANVSVNGQQVLAASDFNWFVLNADGSENTKSSIAIDAEGKAMLTVGESETAKNLVIVAQAKDGNYLGALGMTSVAVDVQDFKISLTNVDTSEYSYGYNGYVVPGQSYTLSLTSGGEAVEVASYKMEIVPTGEGADDGKLNEGTKIDGNTLTIDSAETAHDSFGSSYSTGYNIIEISALDADGNVIATRRCVIHNSGVSTENLIFYDTETGEAVDQYSLVAGHSYTYEVEILALDEFTVINKWVTLADVDREYVVFDDTATYSVGETDAVTLSADGKVLTCNYAAEGIALEITGPMVSVTYPWEEEPVEEPTFEYREDLRVANPVTYEGKLCGDAETVTVLAATTDSSFTWNGMTAKSEFTFSAENVTGWELDYVPDTITLETNGNTATVKIATTDAYNQVRLTATFSDGTTTSVNIEVLHALNYQLNGETVTTWSKASGNPVITLLDGGEYGEAKTWDGVTEDGKTLTFTSNDSYEQVIDLTDAEPGTYYLTATVHVDQYSDATYVGGVLIITE